MDCKRFEDKLNACVDGLSEDEIREFKDHLASCPHCARALEDLKKTRGWLGGLDEIEPPPWFEQKIMQRVRLEQEKKSIWQRLFQPLHIKLPVQALATAIVVIIAIQVFRTVEPEVKTTIAPAPAPAPVTVPATEDTGKKDAAAGPAAVGAKKKAPAAPLAQAPAEMKPARQQSPPQLEKEPPAAAPAAVRGAAETQARPAAAPAKERVAASMPAPSPSAEIAGMRDSHEANKMQAYGSRMDQAGASAVKGKQEQEQAPPAEKSYDFAVSRKKAKAPKPGAAGLAQTAGQSVLIMINPHAPETAIGDIVELLKKFSASNINTSAGIISADVPAEKLEEFSARLARFGELRTMPPPPSASGTVQVSISIGSPSGKADSKVR